MQAHVHRSIDSVDARQWNLLAGTEVPFLRHEFLAALEHTECVGGATGWEPHYVVLEDRRGLAGAVPAFIKTHSYGEFVFDFGWAQAYARSGRNYYPKLTVAVPFTPATSARLLVRPGLERAATVARLLDAIYESAAERQLSSIHALFLTDADRLDFAQAGWLSRRDCQFHWTNRGYGSFEDLLEAFTAEKRKKTRRERRRIEEAGIRFETHFGTTLDAALMDQVYGFHRDTFLRHGHEPYLTRAFFDEIARTLGDALMVKVAMRGTQPVAAAVFFCSKETLFGRYWGAAAEHHSLHFEACYYQGIEFCIERGIPRFEPGTQGEHKVSRGFEPTLSWSAHAVLDERFRAAIRAYLEREAAAVEAYAAEIRQHVPYRARA
jgi:predicted N-acyltransferase